MRDVPDFDVCAQEGPGLFQSARDVNDAGSDAVDTGDAALRQRKLEDCLGTRGFVGRTWMKETEGCHCRGVFKLFLGKQN